MILPGTTIEGLFGEYCTGNMFHHDEYMIQWATTTNMEESQQQQSQTSTESALDGEGRHLGESDLTEPQRLSAIEHMESSQATASVLPSSPPETADRPEIRGAAGSREHVIDLTLDSDDIHAPEVRSRPSSPSKRTYEDFAHEEPPVDRNGNDESTAGEDTSHLVDSQESSISAQRLETRRNAFNAMIGVTSDDDAWNGLLSTTNNHTELERELGEG